MARLLWKSVSLALTFAVLGCTQASTDVGSQTANPAKANPAKANPAKANPGQSAGEIVLAYGGELQGYLYPCNCSDGMLGGLPRKSVFLQKIEEKSTGPVLVVDFGNFIKSPSVQASLKLDTILLCTEIMNKYSEPLGFTLGARDLGLGTSELAQKFANYPGLPLLSANLTLEEVGEFIRPFRRVQVAGVTIFITACMNPTFVAGLPGVVAKDPIAVLTELEAEAEGADLCILLAHAEVEVCRDWINALPYFDVVVGGTEKENPLAPERIGTTTFLCPGIWGKYGLAFTLKRSGEGSWTGSLTKVPLKEELGEDTEILQELKRYKRMLGELHEKRPELLYDEPRAHPGGAYVGSKNCADCHEKAYEIYVASKHYYGLETLKKQGDHVDPECIVCHVVGYGYKTGFDPKKPLPELSGVGCESCHGPGKKHAESTEASDIVLSGEAECRKCHNQIQSPDFDYDHHFAAIEHPEDY